MPFPQGLPIYTLWDEIAYQIDSTKDLLSLALTCRAFEELIIPSHLEYRIIRCSIGRTGVWKHLASRPGLARGVRFVDTMLFGNPNCLLPQCLRETPPAPAYYFGVTEETAVLLKDALSHMNFLRYFAWSQYIDPTQAFVDISKVLPRHLEGLSMHFSHPRPLDPGFDQVKPETIENLSIWNLTVLKRVIIYQTTEAAIRMTLSCPDIEDLSLYELSNTSASYLMQHANWRNLRRLHLHSTSSLAAEDSTIIASFFERHDTIESLGLSLLDTPLPKLPSTYLPSLRSISASDFWVASLLSEGIISRLVHWQCLKAENIDVDYFDDTEIINADILPVMGNLESFYVTGRHNDTSDIADFLRKTPNLQKLSFQIGDINWNDSDSAELTRIFRYSNNLTHIFFDFKLDPPYDEVYNDNIPHTENSEKDSEKQRLENLYKRLSVLRTLKYIRTPEQPWTDKDQVELERDEYGKYSGYHVVEMEDPDRWGNFFRRLTD